MSSKYHGLWTAPAINLMSSAMVRAYCHKVIRLSPVLQSYAPEKEQTSNVHGVRSEFLDEGLRRSRDGWKKGSDGKPSSPDSSAAADGGVEVYFIGKLLWDKGLDIMLDLEDYYKTTTGQYFTIDIYGDGPDKKDITRAFHGRREKIQEKVPSPSKKARKNQNFTSGEATQIILTGANETLADDNLESEDEDDELLPPELSFPQSMTSGYSKLGVKARRRLAKIRQSIDDIDIPKLEIDLPKTLHELRRTPIPATFPGRVDHAKLTQYKVFVNPSISEVLW